jgi:hypothetical protein
MMSAVSIGAAPPLIVRSRPQFAWKTRGRVNQRADMLSNLVPDRRVQAALEGLLPNGGGSKAGYGGHAADARIQVRQPSPNSHLNESQRFFASSLLLSLVRVSWVPPSWWKSMAAIVWQEYRVFTGVSLTRKMTTRVGHRTPINPFTFCIAATPTMKDNAFSARGPTSDISL